MRYALTILAMIFGGYFSIMLASQVYWVLQAFALVGILVIFGGGTWVAARFWDARDENKRAADLEKLRQGKVPSRPGFFD